MDADQSKPLEAHIHVLHGISACWGIGSVYSVFLETLSSFVVAIWTLVNWGQWKRTLVGVAKISILM